MKKLKNILLLCLAAAFLLPQFAGCEKYILPSITFSPDTLYFASEGGTLSSRINSTVKCDIGKPLNSEGEAVSWAECEAGDFEGRGEADIFVSVTENPTARNRTATITVNSEAIRKQLYIIQTPKENE